MFPVIIWAFLFHECLQTLWHIYRIERYLLILSELSFFMLQTKSKEQDVGMDTPPTTEITWLQPVKSSMRKGKLYSDLSRMLLTSWTKGFCFVIFQREMDSRETLTPGRLEAGGQDPPPDDRPAGTAGSVWVCNELHHLAGITLALWVVCNHLDKVREYRQWIVISSLTEYWLPFA